jgi:hypothetical protein
MANRHDADDWSDERERQDWRQRFRASEDDYERDRERDRYVNEDRDKFVSEPGEGHEQWSSRTSQSRFGPGRTGYGSMYGSQGNLGYGSRHSGREYSTAAEFGGGYGGQYGSSVPGRYGHGAGYTLDVGADSWSTESRPGRFSGRGPRGYRRSDDRIRDEVCERLTDADDVDATNIEVSVKDGEVQLSGFVGRREEKRRAERLAEAVAGVRDVHNGLRLQDPRQARRDQIGDGGESSEETPRH